MSSHELDALAQSLDQVERTRAERFVHDRDRRDYILAHAMLRGLLSEAAREPPGAWRFTYDARGRPAIANPDFGGHLRFSLSHTRGFSACAVSADAARIGLDIECVPEGTAHRDVAACSLAPSELAMLDAIDAAEWSARFIELWTLKEAYLKAIGLGLTQPPHLVAFALDDPSAIRFSPPPSDSAATWQFLLAEPAAGYRLAVAVQGGEYATCRVRLVNPDAATVVLRRSSQHTVAVALDSALR
jgi:4'-phosphopantetheinyl transferase